MRQGAVLAAAAFCFALTFDSLAAAQSTSKNPDPVGKLSLMAAAFTDNKEPPAPGQAMAFLPGRGVVTWDVTGKTPEQAREAQIEAMGLADARAVQREIDEAKAQEQARLDEAQIERRVAASDTGTQRLALTLPGITGSAPQTGGIVPLTKLGRSGLGLNVRNADAMKGAPRVYAFAAVSGRSVGLNVLHDDAGWKNAGLTSDRESYTGQKRAGLAWRKGGVQTSLSYVQEKSRMQILGVQSDKDHRLMLSVNVQPQAVAGLFSKTP